jgi:hypothetical protein
LKLIIPFAYILNLMSLWLLEVILEQHNITLFSVTILWKNALKKLNRHKNNIKYFNLVTLLNKTVPRFPSKIFKEIFVIFYQTKPSLISLYNWSQSYNTFYTLAWCKIKCLNCHFHLQGKSNLRKLICRQNIFWIKALY